MGHLGLLDIFLNFRIVFDTSVFRLRFVKYRPYSPVTFPKEQDIKRNKD